MSVKKILLVGFIIVLLVAVPLTVYLVQQQQKSRISAVAKTTLSFNPASKTVSVDETFNLDIRVDPGDTNQVSLLKFIINYDPAKLATEAAGATICPASPTEAFCPNLSAFPNVMQGPIYEPGKISVTLSVGNDLSKAVKALATAGTVTFRALALTESGNPTQITYSDAPDTKVLSIGTNDQFNENVLLDRSPALITIIGEGPPLTETPSPTLSPTEGPTPTEVPTPTPTTEQTTTTETVTSGGEVPTSTETPAIVIETATPTIASEAPSPLPPTGPANLVTIGTLGAVIAVIGVVLLLAL